ncbi:hypothetical protein O6H91_22G039000 [Diphasiastrum complanatum]|uniref:Uncharacterized protein n=1 Tax=Diphasiastrum complanatum TaxID=34168 RepID=A0ACC2AEK9_DIPCM|nr:hypothetical protein O6H91_22G039000 [Diphasiastrum complanatum]
MYNHEGTTDIASHLSATDHALLLSHEPPTLADKSKSGLPSAISSSCIQENAAKNSPWGIDAHELTIFEIGSSSCSTTTATLEMSEPIPEKSTSANFNPHDPGANCLYKKEICLQWEDYGSCRFGETCEFAHGIQDLRTIQQQPKYKTKMCRNFTIEGICPYGTKCLFVHPKFSLGQSFSDRKVSRRLPIFEQICPSSADDPVGSPQLSSA